MRGRQSACSFTGHRPAKLPWRYRESDERCVALKRRIRDAVDAAYAEGYRHFLCGNSFRDYQRANRKHRFHRTTYNYQGTDTDYRGNTGNKKRTEQRTRHSDSHNQTYAYQFFH